MKFALNRVQVFGLENTEYLDKLDDGVQKHQIGAMTYEL